MDSATADRSATVDDRRLIELSAEPAGELFTILNRPHAFWPLLVLLALLPGLCALEYRALDAEGALWGMRGLNVYTADDPEQVLDPGGVTEERLLRWRSPLASWITALAMWLLGPSEPLALVMTSYLATAGIVALGYVFGEWLAGPRCGFWTTLLLAFHGTLLLQAQTPAADSLAIALGMLALLSYDRHIESTTNIVSAQLAFGGLALGLCVLASGRVAVAVLAVLGLSIAGWRGTRTRPRRSPGEEPRRVWVGWGALQSLSVMALLAALIGGWWPVFMAVRYGTAFWHGWLLVTTDMTDLPTPLAAASFVSRLASGAIGVFGPLIGLVLLGIGIAMRNAVANTPENERRRYRLLLTWALFGAAVWLALLPASASVPQLWRGFLLVPGAMLAAVAVNSIAVRRVSLVAVVAFACLTVLAILWPSLAAIYEKSERSTAVGITVASFVSVALAAAWLIQHSKGRDVQKRIILGALVISLAAGNALAGLSRVRRAGGDERALGGFRAELSRLENVTSWMIVGEPPFSLELRLTLRSLWPEADRGIFETWDAALAQALSQPPAADRRTVVVDWNIRDARPTRIRVRELRILPLTRPRFFQNHHLAAYELRAETPE